MVNEALHHPAVRRAWQAGRNFYGRQDRRGKIITLYVAGVIALAIVGGVLSVPILAVVLLFGGGSTPPPSQPSAATATTPSVTAAAVATPPRTFWGDHAGLWDLTSQRYGFTTRYKIAAAEGGATDVWFGTDTNDGNAPQGGSMGSESKNMVQFEVKSPDDVRAPLQFGNNNVLVLHFDGKTISGHEEGHGMEQGKEFNVTGHVE